MHGKGKIVFIVVAAILTLLCVVGGISMFTQKCETNTYDLTQAFHDIKITTNTADIVFTRSKDEKVSVICYENVKMKHSATIQDDSLIIAVQDARKWYEHIAINFYTPKITVYLPDSEYSALLVKTDTGNVDIPETFTFEDIDISGSTGNVVLKASASDSVTIETSTGNICLEGTSAGALNLSVSTGDITVADVVCKGNVKIDVSTGKTSLTDVQCKNLITSGDTGALHLNHVIAAEALSVRRSTGNVMFDSSDAAEILVEMDTGNVTGTLLSEKIFIVHTDTGKVRVPETTTGGKCKITTDTGNIKLEINA